MRSIALHPDCNKRRDMLVFVVTKKTRALLSIVAGQAFRGGCAITGAKAQLSSILIQKQKTASLLFRIIPRLLPLAAH
jgi:hypothetical protein